MGKKDISASFWKYISEGTIRYMVQISLPRSSQARTELKKRFKKWDASGQGYDTKNDIDILIFSKKYDSAEDWKAFLSKSKITELLTLEEVK